MKKSIVLFCCFLPLIYFSQNVRFTYNYKFISDTLSKDVFSEEVVVLDFYSRENQSVFTGLKHIISDSAMAEEARRGIMSFPDASSKVRFVIEKTDNQNSRYFYTPDHMAEPVLKVRDDRKINWEILNENMNILGYKAQKATTFFAGREWTAWFTPEIPISDGPYKFYGLPGLILKILDKTNTHSFEIISIQKQKSNYFILNDNAYKFAKQTTFDVYKKIVEDERKNPLAKLRNDALNGVFFFHTNEEKQQFLKNIDTQIKEIKIHDNNPIEILNGK